MTDLTPDVVAADLDTATRPSRPRTRWGGIVWGLALAAIALAGVVVAAAPQRIADITAWLMTGDPATVIASAIVAVGVLLLLTGVVALLRRAQKAMSARRTRADV